MDMQPFIEGALAAGFSHAAALDCATLTFMDEVREMCRTDKCQKYDRCWTCPPACGSIAECAARAASFTQGIIVQSTATLDDPFDIEGMDALSKRHSDAFERYTDTLRKTHPDLLALGAGGCTRCESCTHPEAPCRHPGAALSSMEAYGLLVSDVCTKNNLPYYYGPGTMTYVGCYLLV